MIISRASHSRRSSRTMYIHAHTHTHTHTHTQICTRYNMMLSTPQSNLSIREHTWVYVSIRQYTCLSTTAEPQEQLECMHTSTLRTRMCVLQDMHMRAYASTRLQSLKSNFTKRQLTSAYVSIRQHTPAYARIRQDIHMRAHTPAEHQEHLQLV